MRTSYIDEETMVKIKKQLTADEWLPLWIAAEGGMRIGDILALKAENVNIGQVSFRAQKTGKEAVISFEGDLQRVLTARAEYAARYQPDKYAWLFPSPKDRRKHLTRQAVWHRVKRACRDAGLPSKGVAPHSFRKRFAVDLFRREGLGAVQAALQHDRAQTTEIYALSDFTSGENASLPLLRGDLPEIVREVLQALRTPEYQPIHRCSDGI